MTSATLIKQEEEESIPLHLYTITSTGPSPEPQWTPNYNHTSLGKPTFMQQPFSFNSEVPLAKVVRGSPRFRHPSFESCELPPIFTNPFVTPFVEPPTTLPAVSMSSTLPTSSDPSASRPRIPRPPNAFMLFRSDFLKRGIIPNNVECRQQNLSRIVGEVWNMLDPAERAKWHERAAIALSEHQQKNPGYRFTPAPRGSRRNKSRGRGDPISDKPDNIRDIREKYVNIMGPSPPSVRKRRQQKTRGLDTEKHLSIPPFTAFNSRTTSFPPPLTKPHHVSRIDQSPPLTPYRSMTTFPEPSIPRRPSTSLGFHPPSKRNHVSFGSPDLRISSTRPPSPASSTSGFLDYVRAHGAELPLSMNQFGSVSAPSSPPSYDRAVGTPYSIADISNGSEQNISGTIDSNKYQKTHLPSPTSLSLYEPMDDANFSTIPPVVDTASPENYHSVDEFDATALLASFGFTDEMLASLTPASESMQGPMGESTSQMWLPSGSLNLEDWELNVCPDSIFAFTVGDL